MLRAQRKTSSVGLSVFDGSCTPFSLNLVMRLLIGIGMKGNDRVVRKSQTATLRKMRDVA